MIFICKEVNVYNYEYHYHYNKKEPVQPSCDSRIGSRKKKLRLHFNKQQLEEPKNQDESVDNPILKQQKKRENNFPTMYQTGNGKSTNYKKSCYLGQKQQYEQSLRNTSKNPHSLEATIALNIPSRDNSPNMNSLNQSRNSRNKSIQKSRTYNPLKYQKIKSLVLGSNKRLEQSYELKGQQEKQSEQKNTKKRNTDQQNEGSESIKKIKDKISEFKRVTVISQQIAGEQSFCADRFVVDESSIMEYDIQGKFTPITRLPKKQYQESNGQYLYSEYIAMENQLNLIVSIKQIITDTEASTSKLFEQINTYNEIDEHHGILQFYRLYLHRGNKLLVRQPFLRGIKGYSYQAEQVQEKLKFIKDALEYLENKQIYLDWLEPSDLRDVFGIWKIGNIGKKVSKENRIEIPVNLLNLKRLVLMD